MSKYLKPAGKAVFKDSYTTKMNELLVEPDGSKKRYGIIGAPLSKPSISHSGAAFAPGAIRQAMGSYSTFSKEVSHDFQGENVIDFGDVDMHPTDIIDSQDRIYQATKSVLDQEEAEQLIILGGDHSVSFPSIKAHHEKYGAIGVIQFDAHHDLRNLDDGGPTNGTPFRRSIEKGVLKGEHIVQIGIRDFTNAKGYDDYAEQQGVTVYTMEDMMTNKINEIIQQALQKLENKVDLIYLSVDMDVLDQAFAPGCPAIGPGGMDSYSLMKAVETAAKHDKVQAMDIVEIDPTIDLRNMTSRVAAHVIFSYWKGKVLGK
ncbi:formimidoylglutamase [Alkalibacillus haloalkaliphilus]|uniref:formimidoylglutamase n=1 Tax=Alkalibacillus haloalkaliphilus TaxID=94136 RepID=UPI002935D351|nr:formimidoylglutamase [Alkalibacillus haloalkaliphilus]MDV2581284.1 formimidoylglutamase [Alkalibacillus haloalkaliphilus]